LKSRCGKHLDGAGKVLGDHIPYRPSLTSNRHAERIGAKLLYGSRQEPGHGGTGCRVFEELSPGNSRHNTLPKYLFGPNHVGPTGGIISRFDDSKQTPRKWLGFQCWVSN
jgi:hypothetical protein